MAKLRATMLVMVLTFLVVPVQAASVQPTLREIVGRIADPPNDVLFIENVGQFPPEVRFYALGVGLWIGDDRVWQQNAGDRERDVESRMQEARQGIYAPYSDVQNVPSISNLQSLNLQSSISKLLISARFGVQPFGRSSERIRFYPTADPATWREDVPAWHGVRLVDVYPGVDLELTGTAGGVVSRWLCTGACPADLPALTTTATTPQAVTDNPSALIGGTFIGGSVYDGLTGLVLGTDGAAYVAGSTSSTDAGFTGPVFVAAYTPDLKTRRFITFLGGDLQYDTIHDLARDAANNLYVAGSTWSRQFPVTPGAFDTVLNDGRTDNCPTGDLQKPCPDAFAARFNAAGQLTYATYLGGAKMDIPGAGNFGGDDYGVGIRADAAGNLYVVGNTDSDDFPTTAGAYDRTFSYMDIGLNPDVFVVKLRPNGAGAADLVYSTYVGAGFVNTARGMALDAQGMVYVTGEVEGHTGLIPPQIDFPRTPNAYPNASACLAYYCQDVFFFKLRPAGQSSADMLYSTFFGGSASATLSEIEGGADVALLPNGAVVIAGVTVSGDFPVTSGAFLTTYPLGASPTGFVARLNPAGQGVADLQYSTFLGGRGGTHPLAAAVDAEGQVYVTGSTTSPDFPFTRGAFDSTLNGRDDAFIARLALLSKGSDDLTYGSFLGGYDDDGGKRLAPGPMGTVYLAGTTYSADLPLPADGHDPTQNGGADGFIARLALGNTNISGRLVDADGAPLAGIAVTAGTYAVATNSQGQYSFADLPAGTYTVVPGGSYFWEPAQRIVAGPPDATGQDFVGRSLVKTVTLSSKTQGTLLMGTRLTYTVGLVFPDTTTRDFYDAVPTYTTYIPGSLTAPTGVEYDSVQNAIVGPLMFTPGAPFTVTFAVQTTISGGPDFAPQIVNRACVHTPGNTLLLLACSNEVRTSTYVYRIYLPLTLCNY